MAEWRDWHIFLKGLRHRNRKGTAPPENDLGIDGVGRDSVAEGGAVGSRHGVKNAMSGTPRLRGEPLISSVAAVSTHKERRHAEGSRKNNSRIRAQMHQL